MRGEYICRSSRLYSLHWTCRKLARALSFTISHVPRENNAEANQLANTAVRERAGQYLMQECSVQPSALSIQFPF